MISRVTQLLARYIAVLLIAVVGAIGAEADHATIEELSAGLAAAAVAVCLFIVDQWLHKWREASRDQGIEASRQEPSALSRQPWVKSWGDAPMEREPAASPPPPPPRPHRLAPPSSAIALVLLLACAACAPVNRADIPAGTTEGLHARSGFTVHDGDADGNGGRFGYQGNTDPTWLQFTKEWEFDVASASQPAVLQIDFAQQRVFFASPGDVELTGGEIKHDPKTGIVTMKLATYGSDKSAVMRSIAEQIDALDSWVEAGAITQQERDRVAGLVAEAFIRAAAAAATGGVSEAVPR